MLATFSQLRKRVKCRQAEESSGREVFRWNPTKPSRLTPIENPALFWREIYPKLKKQLQLVLVNGFAVFLCFRNCENTKIGPQG